jgi:hypothetical protein
VQCRWLTASPLQSGQPIFILLLAVGLTEPRHPTAVWRSGSGCNHARQKGLYLANILPKAAGPYRLGMYLCTFRSRLKIAFKMRTRRSLLHAYCTFAVDKNTSMPGMQTQWQARALQLKIEIPSPLCILYNIPTAAHNHKLSIQITPWSTHPDHAPNPQTPFVWSVVAKC